MDTLYQLVIIPKDGYEEHVFIEAEDEKSAKLKAYIKHSPCEIKNVIELF